MLLFCQSDEHEVQPDQHEVQPWTFWRHWWVWVWLSACECVCVWHRQEIGGEEKTEEISECVEVWLPYLSIELVVTKGKSECATAVLDPDANANNVWQLTECVERQEILFGLNMCESNQQRPTNSSHQEEIQILDLVWHWGLFILNIRRRD